jgi:asparagine synthase (glutamine-hydrolysing)
MKEREGGGEPFEVRVRAATGELILSGYRKEGEARSPFVHGYLSGNCQLSHPGDGLSSDASGEFVTSWMEDQALVAVRDHMGCRPLYCAESGGISAFCTDLAPLSELRMNPHPLPQGAVLRLSPDGVAISLPRPIHRTLPFEGTLDEAAEKVWELLLRSLEDRRRNAGTVAVSFSGGLDSSLLATALAKLYKVVLVSVFARGSKDAQSTSDAADSLGLELISFEVGGDEVREALNSLGGKAPFLSVMDRSLAAGFFLASTKAAELGIRTLVAGQGADEIFAGYHRYLEPHSEGLDLIERLRRELPHLESGLRRDECAIAYGGCDASFPYSDRRLAEFSFSLPHSFLISGRVRKVVLRRLARKVGLPSKIADAEKKAFQYSSGIYRLVGPGP